MKTRKQVELLPEKDNTAVANCLVLASSSCCSASLAQYTVLPMLLFTKSPKKKLKSNFEVQVSEVARRNFPKIHQRSYKNVSFVSNHSFAAILPGDSLAGIVVANGISNFLNIYNTLLICRLVLTWFPNSPPAIVSPLSTLCDPYLNIFRGIIPPLGGTLDLSPILAFLVLNAFTSTAAALPAELPPTMESQNQSPLSSSNLTLSQQKRTRKLLRRETKNTTDDN